MTLNAVRWSVGLAALTLGAAGLIASAQPWRNVDVAESHEIKAGGGNLLIISSEKERSLEKILWDNNLSLSFYFDEDKEIAKKFRIYSESDPIWNKFSGIDTNVPLLATYVISPAGQVEYDHIDPDFSKIFPSKDIISAVQKSDPSVKSINNKFNRQIDYYRGRAY